MGSLLFRFDSALELKYSYPGFCLSQWFDSGCIRNVGAVQEFQESTLLRV